MPMNYPGEYVLLARTLRQQKVDFAAAYSVLGGGFNFKFVNDLPDVAENMIFKNLTVLALNGRKIFDTWYRTRWLLEGGVVDIRPLITRQLPMSKIDEAIDSILGGEACKIVLQPDGPPFEPPAPVEQTVTEPNGIRPIPHH